jgi:hypothetical protein
MTFDHGTTVPQTGATSEQTRPGQVAVRAGEEASNVAQTATEGVREVAHEMRTQANAVAGQARQQFEDLVGQARDEFRQQAQQRNDQAAEQFRTLSERITALADGRPEDAGPLPGYLGEVEGRVRSLATRLEDRGPQGVMQDLTDLARRRPGVFLAGAVGLGFVIGRTVRAGTAAQQAAGSTSQWTSPSRPEPVAGLAEEPLVPQGNGPRGLSSGMRQ